MAERDGTTPATEPAPSFGRWLAEHRNELDAVLLDVDGVLITGRRPLPGAPELSEWLRDNGVPFFLLTNDGCNSPRQKVRGLAASGMKFRVDEIVSASHGLAELVEQRGWRGRRFFLMGGQLGNPCYAEAAGLAVIRSTDRLHDCFGVVVGEKKYDWEEVITAVFNFLIRNPEAPLVIPNPDAYFPARHGRLHLASGATGGFVQQLCQSYGRELEPIYLGKPYEPIFLHAHHRLERKLDRSVPRDRVVIVGDSLASDIRGGRDFGYRTALVLSGLTTPPMLSRAPIQPDLAFEGL